jgi:hypothetical protein
MGGFVQVLSKIAGVRLAVVSLAMLGVLMVVGCGGTSSTSSNVTATPSFSPGGGTYNASQSVTISGATPNSVFYCTTDGTTPTASSPKCAQPTTVFQTEFLQAIAVAPGKAASAVASAGYTIDLNAAATPTFSPAGSTYTSAQTVTISSATSGANIYYTTDGTVPSTSSTLYTGAVIVSKSETLSAIATASGYNNSGVASAAYTIVPPAAAPTFSPAGGPYTSAQTVTIADTTPGAAIYYTTDGTPATATSTRYSTPVAVTQSETINAIAVASGYSSTTASAIYSINLQQALAPTFSLANNQLTIGDGTAGATIYYTTDGSQPSASSPLHGAAPLTITVTPGETVNAIAVATGYATSTVATYTVSLSAASQPTFSLGSNSLSDTASGATIYYTIDGTQPSTASPLHGAAPVTITVTAGEAVNAIAVAANYVSSTVGSFTARAAQTPSFSLTGSQLTISDTTTGATIYYTIDGTQPTTSSPLSGSSPITITVTGGEVINAIAAAPNYLNSIVENYTVGVTGTPEFSLSGGSLTINDATSGAVIYYTINGSAPTISSPLHGNAPVTVAVSIGDIVQAIALAPGNTVSALASYTVKATAATPQITPNGGYFISSQVPVSVSITEASSGATVYYTIDGTTPSATNGTAYATSFTVTPTASSPTVTVKAIAVGSNYNDSAEADSAITLLVSPTISGKVVSGPTPISGATVQLFVAGTTGYASAPSTSGLNIKGNLTTDASGSFAFSYTCPAATTSGGDLLYLVATKDNSGDGSNKVRLMTALGSCNDSTNTAKWSPSVTVNEATTIASAYALSAFAKVDTTNGGIDVGAPATKNAQAPTCDAGDKWLSSGKETCNYNGLKSAFAAANNLVNIGTGVTRSYTPDYPTNLAGDPNIVNNSNVPTARINALADMLASCVESNGSGCSGSTNLFGAASTNGSAPGGSTIAPTDTLQAALNIAQNPGSNGISVSALLSLVPTTNQPYPTASLVLSGAGAPTDLTLALTFTGAGLGLSPTTSGTITLSWGSYSPVGPMSNTALAIDASGNIWVTAFAETGGLSPSDGLGGYVLAEFNNLGAPSPLTPATAIDSSSNITLGGFDPDNANGNNDFGPSSIAIDQSGNLWMGDGAGAGTIFEVGVAGSGLSVLIPNSNLSIAPQAVSNLAIDKSGDLWVAVSNHGTKVYQNDGTAFPLSGPVNATYLTFDSNNSLWVELSSDTNGPVHTFQPDVNEVNTSTGAIEFQAFTNPSSPGVGPATLVADDSGYVYGCADQNRALDIFINGTQANAGSAPVIATGRACGNQLVLDGLGHLFAVTDTGNSPITHAPAANIDEFTTGGVLISPQTNGYTGTSSAEQPTLNPDGVYGATTTGISAAIDGAGNLWVLNADTGGTVSGNALVEYVGIGAPVVTPTSVALAQSSSQLGVRP